jgi:uncharacterized protein (TIGR02117 family)
VRHLLRTGVLALAVLLGLGVLYLLAAVAGALIHPGRDADAGDAVFPVYLVWSEIHTDIILPVAGLTVDWRTVLADGDAPSQPPEHGHLAFGWGSESFYRDVPTMADITPGILARALFFDATVLHVAPVADPIAIAPERRITLFVTEDGMRALEQHVLATLVLDDGGKADALAGATYGYGDVFYHAHGRYNPIRTCNQWTSEALRVARIPAGFWTPFSQSITWVFDTDAEREAAVR